VKTITESGWYRIGKDGWERVAPPDVRAGDVPGAGWDLVHVKFEDEEVTLW
jgi:hypothetical protein